MRLLIIALCMLLPSTVLMTPRASAQFGGIVHDPANHSQNILTAVRSLQEINQQIQQITHEIQMLENMAKDLQSLPTSIADELRNKILTVDNLIKIAKGIEYEVVEVEKEYEIIYRESYGTTPPPTPVIVQEARDAWVQSREGFKHSLQVQAQVVTNIRDDINKLHGLVGDSQGAAGNLEVVQAGNKSQRSPLNS